MIRPLTTACLAGIIAFGAAASATLAQTRQQDRTVREVERQTERQIDQRDRRDMQRQRDPQATLYGMRVAILTGEGLHDGETLMPMAYLQNRGARVTVIGLERGLVKAYNSDIRVRIERSIGEVSPDDFDALVLPGGRAPSALREHSEVVNFARDFFNTGKPVAAICHGPQILATAGVLEGRNATCIESISDEIREAGARYQDRPVVRDRNLVTSRIPDDIPVFLAMTEATMIEHGAQQQRRPDARPDRPERPERPTSPARPGTGTGSPR